MTAARDNIILVVVNLDPYRKQNSFIYVPIESFGQMESDAYQVHDLAERRAYTWRGSRNYVELDPEFNRRMSSGCAADNCRDPATAGDRLSARFCAPGDRSTNGTQQLSDALCV